VHILREPDVMGLWKRVENKVINCVRFEVFTEVTMKNGVALVRTDVSEELSTSFIRVTRRNWYFFAACVGCLLQLALFLVHRFLSP
jgi:hypothetical protein